MRVEESPKRFTLDLSEWEMHDLLCMARAVDEHDNEWWAKSGDATWDRKSLLQSLRQMPFCVEVLSGKF